MHHVKSQSKTQHPAKRQRSAQHLKCTHLLATKKKASPCFLQLFHCSTHTLPCGFRPALLHMCSCPAQTLMILLSLVCWSLTATVVAVLPMASLGLSSEPHTQCKLPLFSMAHPCLQSQSHVVRVLHITGIVVL